MCDIDQWMTLSPFMVDKYKEQITEMSIEEKMIFAFSKDIQNDQSIIIGVL